MGRSSKNGDRRDSKSFRHFYIMTALQQGIPAGQLRVMYRKPLFGIITVDIYNLVCSKNH